MIKITVDTKWSGGSEEIEVSTEDLGFTQEQWDNMSDDEKYDAIQEEAMEAIGFGFSYQEI